MKYSWKLGRWAGIDVFLHWSFLILLGWVTLSYMASGGGIYAAVHGVGFLIAVFSCVVMHEFGHALMARKFGIETRDITMFPIGGVARLERMPEKPRQEMAVALAGPAVNVLIVIVLLASLILYSGLTNILWRLTATSTNILSGTLFSFLTQLIWANIILIVFNLLPAFPMDGGRVFRAFLAIFLPRVRATQIASTVGQMLAIGLGIVGLFSNPMLVLVATFVFFAARHENQFVELQSSMQGAFARDAMVDQFRVLSAHSRLVDVARKVLLTSQEDFPIVDHRRVVGMLSKAEVLRKMADGEGQRTVSELMRNTFPRIESGERLDDCFGRFQTEGWNSAAVFDAERLVGMVTFENLTRWLQLQPVLCGALSHNSTSHSRC